MVYLGKCAAEKAAAAIEASLEARHAATTAAMQTVAGMQTAAVMQVLAHAM